MTEIKGLAEVLASHPLFQGFDAETMAFLEGCAKNEVFQAGTYIFKADEPADRFFLLRAGDVALELQVPGRARLTVKTLHPGEVLGASWMLPPYSWRFDARALSAVRATSIDAECLRRKCDDNPALGYEVLKRFLPILAERLQAARVQLVDLYAPLSSVGQAR